MKKSTIIKLVLFNSMIAGAGIILYNIISSLREDISNALAANILTVVGLAVGAGLLFGVNYVLLNKPDGPVSAQQAELDDAQDYRDALKSWKSNKHPFNADLNEAIAQLDRFYQKRTILRNFLGSQNKADGDPFFLVSEDVEAALFSNMKKLINRMAIIDPNDKGRFPMHKKFILSLLDQNRLLLEQYDNLIIEISQIGDTAAAQTPDLEEITEALSEMRGGAAQVQSPEDQKFHQEMQQFNQEMQQYQSGSER